MKVLAPVYVVCLCAVLGFARPDGENTLSEGEVLCRRLGNQDRYSFRDITRMVSGCVKPDNAKQIQERLETATTIEHFKEAVKLHCDQAPIFQECIVSTRVLAERCLSNPVHVGKMRVDANLLKQLLEVACFQDGARVASLLQQLVLGHFNSTRRNTFVDNCLRQADENFDREAATVSQYSLQQYQAFMNFKTCFVDYTNRREVGLEDMKAVLNEFGNVLTCVGEDSVEPILCKTLAAQRCVAHDSELDDTAPQVYNTYFRRFGECRKQDENSSSIVSQFIEAHTAEEYKHVFMGICNISLSERQCLADTRLNVELCFQEGFLNTFKGVLKMMYIGMDVVCDDEGVQLANILAAVRTAGATSLNFAKRCFIAAVEGFKDEAGWNDNTLLVYYRGIMNFKNCIADYGREHNQAAVDLASFVDDSVNEMRCYDGTTDNYVLCNTLVN